MIEAWRDDETVNEAIERARKEGAAKPAQPSGWQPIEAGGDETGCLALHLCTALADVMSIDPRDENYIDTRGLAGELIETLDAFRAASSPKRENETD